MVGPVGSVGGIAAGDSFAGGIAGPGPVVDSPVVGSPVVGSQWQAAWLVVGSQWRAVEATVPVAVDSPQPAVRSVLVGPVPVELERVEFAEAGSCQGAGLVGQVVVADMGFPQS